jgi:hypothetical protein
VLVTNSRVLIEEVISFFTSHRAHIQEVPCRISFSGCCIVCKLFWQQSQDVWRSFQEETCEKWVIRKPRIVNVDVLKRTKEVAKARRSVDVRAPAGSEMLRKRAESGCTCGLKRVGDARCPTCDRTFRNAQVQSRRYTAGLIYE